jgi:hypothetical protein
MTGTYPRELNGTAPASNLNNPVGLNITNRITHNFGNKSISDTDRIPNIL